ncbi:MAG: hypothetical protein H9893_01365 [Candidatus Niameybacter stercoravium]|nr:hypothetical protein [Candidatus Niameybacter stercoravium]
MHLTHCEQDSSNASPPSSSSYYCLHHTIGMNCGSKLMVKPTPSNYIKHLAVD